MLMGNFNFYKERLKLLLWATEFSSVNKRQIIIYEKANTPASESVGCDRNW